jgi:1-acyl-sn-glycerol-3-phosphate acyltransferase/nucleoside-diphosphate-sugar epimerase
MASFRELEIPPMSKIELVACSGNPLALSLLQALRKATVPDLVNLRTPEDKIITQASTVYIPGCTNRDCMSPDLSKAQRVFQQYARIRSKRFILLGSALIYGTGPARQSMVKEGYDGRRNSQPRVCNAWRSLEAMAHQYIEEKSLIILRSAIVLPALGVLSTRLMRWLTVTLPGRNPVVQIVSPSDLASAVLRAVVSDRRGVFNVAPDGAVPLHAAIRIAGSHRIPLPGTLQRLVRNSETLDYLRYPWTVSNSAIKEQLGFSPSKSSVAALIETRGHRKGVVERTFDDFGMDEEFIRSCGKTLFKFLSDIYWRIETQGMEYIPLSGRAVLVGTHRGFMPWDGVMALHLVVRETGRFPRFLTHPGLFKFPFISSLMTKLGGVIACQESAGRVLQADELLGIYPEGVQGAFALHRNAYKLQPSWRNTFVKMALRHRAAIVPFVNIGSADSLPVFAQIRSRFWTRYATWPCIPISTFPFLPVPLPSKWHVQFLPPIHAEQQYPPESAQDAALVKSIGLDVKCRMQEAMETMVRRRRSIFF